MAKSFDKLLSGYNKFRDTYAKGTHSLMSELASGQSPETMVIACSDSRIDPAVVLQCEPGDIFVVRNVANVVPPYSKDDSPDGTCSALEYGVCYLKIKTLVILGHSGCGGISARINRVDLSSQDDFISNWVKLIDLDKDAVNLEPDEVAKLSLKASQANCATFPWLADKIASGEVDVRAWYLSIKDGVIEEYNTSTDRFEPLSSS